MRFRHFWGISSVHWLSDCLCFLSPLTMGLSTELCHFIINPQYNRKIKFRNSQEFYGICNKTVIRWVNLVQFIYIIIQYVNTFLFRVYFDGHFLFFMLVFSCLVKVRLETQKKVYNLSKTVEFKTNYKFSYNFLYK